MRTNMHRRKLKETATGQWGRSSNIRRSGMRGRSFLRTDRSIGIARQHGIRERSFLRNGARRGRSRTTLVRRPVATARDSDAVRVGARGRPMIQTRGRKRPADEPTPANGGIGDMMRTAREGLTALDRCASEKDAAVGPSTGDRGDNRASAYVWCSQVRQRARSAALRVIHRDSSKR